MQTAKPGVMMGDAVPKLGLVAGPGKGRVTARPPGAVCLQGKGLVYVPRSCLLADHSQGVNFGAGRRARGAIALTLNRLTESAGAASGAVMIRIVSVRMGPRGLDALPCPQGGRSELVDQGSPHCSLQTSLGNACGESSRPHPLRVLLTRITLCPGLRGHAGPSAPRWTSLV